MPDLFSGMPSVFAGAFGRRYAVRTEDGRDLLVEGIPKLDYRESQIGEFGVSQYLPWPRLDLRVDQLKAQGVLVPEEELHDAAVTIDGVPRRLVDFRLDGAGMIRCRVALA